MNRFPSFRPRQLVLSLALIVAFIMPAMPVAAAPAQPASTQPAPARQETEPVFALPGVLQRARDMPFDTYLLANDDQQYGLVGKTPDIEREITAFRDAGSDVEVKVWGTLYPNGRLSNEPEIIVSDIQSDVQVGEQGPEAPAAETGTSVAIVRVDVANVRSGPGTVYPTVGQLSLNQVCPIAGRNADNSWWMIECASLDGWISDTVVRTVADPNRLPVLVVPPPTIVQPPAVPSQPQTFAGWKASYFTNANLTGTPAVVQDVADINFNWGTGSPNPAIPSDYFSARYERTVNFAPGNYRFTARYDDGVRVYIDGQLIIDDWNAGSDRTRVADRTLSGNHAIVVEYFEATQFALLQFSWAIFQNQVPPSQPARKEDWNTSYYNNTDLSGTPALQAVTPRSGYPLDQDWGNGSPAPGIIGNDNFSARFTATYSFDAGDYTFRARVDDGVRVYIDNIRVLDNWSDGFKEFQNTFRGLGGGDHTITVEYYERGGTAFVRVWWWKEQYANNDKYANRDE